LNCVEIRFLSKLSLSNCSKWLYFLKICISQIDIHIATQIIHANAKNDTLKLANVRNMTENIKAEIESGIIFYLLLKWTR
jgi:hypothetical protein